MDYNRIAMLLSVFDKVKEHPNLDFIRSECLAEMKQINDEWQKAKVKAPPTPTRPILADGRVDTTDDPDVPTESISRNPDGTIRTVKVDPLDEPIVERRV